MLTDILSDPFHASAVFILLCEGINKCEHMWSALSVKHGLLWFDIPVVATTPNINHTRPLCVKVCLNSDKAASLHNWRLKMYLSHLHLGLVFFCLHY